MIERETLHQGAVDFHIVDGQVGNQTLRVAARAEMFDSEAEAEFAQAVGKIGGVRQIFRRGLFADLNRQTPGLDARGLELILQPL